MKRWSTEQAGAVQTGCKNNVGVTHSTTGMCKFITVKRKNEAGKARITTTTVGSSNYLMYRSYGTLKSCERCPSRHHTAA